METSSTSSPDQTGSESSLLSQEIPENFPSELIIEILTRLPVKSLLRLRCVSKSWLCLLSDTEFIKAHLEKSSGNNQYTHHRLIFHNFHSESCITQCPLHSALYSPVTKATNIYPASRNNQVLGIVGSCNGLICFTDFSQQAFLWNPALRKTKRLPELDDTLGRRFFSLSYGFGYDEANDDYKVIGVCTIWGHNRMEARVVAYSLKTDCWRRVQDLREVRLEAGCFTKGKLSNGKLHWTLYNSFDTGRKIVSFDLSNERYGEVEQPDYGKGISWTLEVLGGCLSLFSYHRMSHVDIWVMKEYGVRDSWTKMVLVCEFNDPEYNIFCTPLFVSKDGEILLQFGEVMVCYNPDNKSLTYPKITNSGALQGANVYVESLVWPDSPDREYHPS